MYDEGGFLWLLKVVNIILNSSIDEDCYLFMFNYVNYV